MTTIADASETLAARITAGGQVKAYTDPGQASANRPSVLVAPPTLNYADGTQGGPLVTWRLICLPRQDAANLAALQELADLIDAVTAAVPTVERAEPSTYAVTGGQRLPAYVLTLTT